MQIAFTLKEDDDAAALCVLEFVRLVAGITIRNESPTVAYNVRRFRLESGAKAYSLELDLSEVRP